MDISYERMTWLARQFSGLFDDLCYVFFPPDFYGGNISVLEKDDGSLASGVGLEVERRYFTFLDQYFPDVAVVSEETRNIWPSPVDTFWLLDPDDGTHNLLWGLPAFGSMAALIENRQVVFSAIFLPAERAMGRSGLYVAARGAGAWEWMARPRPLHVSKQRDLGKASLFLEGPSRRLEGGPTARLKSAVRRHRINLSVAWTGTRVAIGGLTPASADLMVSSGNQPWDNLPVALLIEEAGGRVTDHRGQPWSIENFSELIFSNGVLHEQALAVLGGK